MKQVKGTQSKLAYDIIKSRQISHRCSLFFFNFFYFLSSCFSPFFENKNVYSDTYSIMRRVSDKITRPISESKITFLGLMVLWNFFTIYEVLLIGLALLNHISIQNMHNNFSSCNYCQQKILFLFLLIKRLIR